jgi:tyrosyl-tRNA synthetase
MRPVLSHEKIRHNTEGLKTQLSRYMRLDGQYGLLLNNMDWLVPLNYIEFLRDIGRHFSVNRMLTAESVKQRLETGLSFIEFNYQLLQAYDFLHLFSHHDCLLQMGGADQWGNIVAGIDLIRRMKGGKAYGLTFPLIVTSSGEKMGKTAKGAVWLDSEKTNPYEYYQFWINTDDQDVRRFLALFTFLNLTRIEELTHKGGAELRFAKEVLAFEATTITHGQEAAQKAQETSRNLFYGQGLESGAVPEARISRKKLEEGMEAYLLLVDTGACQTRGEARRLIGQGGVSLNDSRISSFDQMVYLADFKGEPILLKIGKKRFIKIIFI